MKDGDGGGGGRVRAVYSVRQSIIAANAIFTLLDFASTVVFRDTISSRDDRKFDLQGPKRGTRATSFWAQFSWISV